MRRKYKIGESCFYLALIAGACIGGGWFYSKFCRLEPNPNFIEQPYSVTLLDLALIVIVLVLVLTVFVMWWRRLT